MKESLKILGCSILLLIASVGFYKFLQASAPVDNVSYNYYSLMSLKSALANYTKSSFPNSLDELVIKENVNTKRIYFYDIKTKEKQDWLYLGDGKKFSELKEGDVIISSPVYHQKNISYKIEIQKRNDALDIKTIKIE